MTPVAPPWCLQWTPSGELDPHDRRDLLLRLTGREAGLARRVLARAASAEACRLRPRRPMPKPAR